MTPRMAKMWLEAQREEGIDVDAKKIDAINSGIEALCKQAEINPVTLENPIIRKKVTYTRACPLCCRILTDKSYYCDNCGQAIYTK